MTIKHPDAQLVSADYSLIRQRTARTTFQWVRGHSGDLMNQRAHAAANAARQDPDSPPILPAFLLCAHDQFFLAYDGIRLQYHGRRLARPIAV